MAEAHVGKFLLGKWWLCGGCGDMQARVSAERTEFEISQNSPRPLRRMGACGSTEMGVPNSDARWRSAADVDESQPKKTRPSPGEELHLTLTRVGHGAAFSSGDASSGWVREYLPFYRGKNLCA
jgi:hypothetical protein